MAFTIPKTLALNFLGEGWHAAYITFSLPGLEETFNQPTPTEAEMAEDPKKHLMVMVSFVEQHFIDGQGWDGTQLVALKADDIRQLPPIVFVEATKLLAGTIDPNSAGASNS